MGRRLTVESNMSSTESEPLSTRHSIVFNTLVAFVVIIGVSLVSMLASLYLADALEGDAEAINQAWQSAHAGLPPGFHGRTRLASPAL